MGLDITETDIKDMTEGIKKRSPHKFKDIPKPSKEDKLVNFIVGQYGNIDIRSTAKLFEKTTGEVSEILTGLGYHS